MLKCLENTEKKPKGKRLKKTKETPKESKAKKNNTEHKKDLEDGKKVNKLKKPASAFILYSMQKRKEIVEENPELGLGAVGKLLGEKWKALTEEEQGMWKRKAAKLREEYEKSNPDKGKKSRKRSKPEPKQVESKKSGDIDKALKRGIADSDELFEKVMSIIKKRTSEDKVEKAKKVKKVEDKKKEEDDFIEE
eukprot:TRINITY_DN1652_c0_g1_i51.p2 TRINITY_DN1652_c0_g1~~TRINITY_DN1652_c0_g1_i51.p2  ORF type:complete len:193 (+),score=82.83 TRINITY_DN1652_c0_g1_i51:259-837(+)